MGIWGFSVLEVPGGDYEQLARMRPIVADRRQFLVADGESLIDDFDAARRGTMAKHRIRRISPLP